MSLLPAVILASDWSVSAILTSDWSVIVMSLLPAVILAELGETGFG